jgi:hypothetical protein
VILNIAVAVSAGTAPISLPDTVTAYVPVAIEGTVNVHEKVPVAEVVVVVQVCATRATPLNVIVPIAVDAENPEPVIVTEVSFGPWVGDKVTVGIVTVKVTEAVSPVTVPMSLPDKTTVYMPGEIDGTVNLHVKVPVAEVVWEVQV